MTPARTLVWPLAMGASVIAGLVLAFLQSGVWDAAAWALAGWPLCVVASALFRQRTPRTSRRQKNAGVASGAATADES